MKDYEDDLVFKWQNKLEESMTELKNSSPEKEVRAKDATNSEKSIKLWPRWES